MTASGLAVVQPESGLAPRNTSVRLGLPTSAEMKALQEYGEVIIKSGLAPKHINTWQAAVVTMRYGHQLGIDEFTALQHMYVIGGKPAADASLLHAMIIRDHGDEAIVPIEMSPKAVRLACKRRGAKQVIEVGYTIAEAQQAGLKTETWLKYPQDMLFARAISRAGRIVFRDSTMGMYVPEEVGLDIIEVDGETVQPSARPAPIRPEVVDGHTGEIVPTVDAANAMARLHAVGTERGIGHEQIHSIAVTRLGIESLAAATTAQLLDLATAIEICSDDDLISWSGDWLAQIAECATVDCLASLGKEMAAVGITRQTHKPLFAAYNQRKIALARAVPTNVTEQSGFDDMPADADRYTA